MANPYVLVVEDEAPLVAMLRYNLERAGFDAAEAADGEEAILAVGERRPDLVVLDWMLPLMSGLEVCRQLRRRPDTRDIPIIMLTARGEEGDRVRGLESGASLGEEKLAYCDVTMDLVAHRVSRGGRTIRLGPTEFRLLRHFLEHPGRVFSREQLLDAVWGHDVYVEPRTVDVHIRRLRRALNEATEPDLIRTVRSAGYALDREAA